MRLEPHFTYGSSNGPQITIAIPTFDRPDLLQESIESAARQNSALPFEILVVDNKSAPDALEQIETYLSTYTGPPLRFYVNDANLGMFGNWNRCIALARGAYMTILSDDDLLRPDYLVQMTRALDRVPVGASLTCRVATLDQRAERPADVSGPKTRAKEAAIGFARFGGSRRTRLTPNRLFWGNIAGSFLGCLFPREQALAMGGFDQQEFPAADFALHLKFAAGPGIFQVRSVLCDMRLRVNESMKPSTIKGFVTLFARYRRRMIEAGQVPTGWNKWLPVLAAYEIDAARRNWGVTLDTKEMEAALGFTLPPGPHTTTWFRRLAHRGV